MWLPGASTSVPPASCGRGLPLGEFVLPHSHLQFLSLVDRTVLVDISCLGGCERNMSTFNPSLHCCSPPVSTVSWTQVATAEEHTRIDLVLQRCSQQELGVYLVYGVGIGGKE